MMEKINKMKMETNKSQKIHVTSWNPRKTSSSAFRIHEVHKENGKVYNKLALEGGA